MKLTYDTLHDPAWTAKGYALPTYDPRAMRAATLARPTWLHIGAGNIFRAFPAALQQRLLNEGLADTGIVVAESFDPELVARAYHAYNNLSLLVTLCTDGAMRKEVIASVAEAVTMQDADYDRLRGWFAAPSLQMVSFTITEKGYALRDGQGALLPDVARELADGPAAPRTAMGRVTALLLHRFTQGATPLAMVSMDNCSHNGDKLKDAVLTIAQAWTDAGFVPAGFVPYLQTSVSFPWTMIDKITPRPDARVVAALEADGFEDTQLILTEKRTYSAPFVNAEQTEYLVVEDSFPNGRPPLEKAGVYFADRATVDKVERMKVCTCLNPLHTALAVLGCLLGYETIYEEMRDPDLRRLAERIGADEGMPVVTHPGILAPTDFLREVLDVRLPNPFLPDAPQRIATDTSQKLPIRFGETIKAYAADTALDVQSLRCIPFALAAWLRYLLATDDQGAPMACSPDPLLADCQAALAGLTLGERDTARIAAILRPLLADARLWGVDLCALGLADRVTADVTAMLAGPGAVRAALHAVVA